MLVRQKQQALFEHFRDVFPMFFFFRYIKLVKLSKGNYPGWRNKALIYKSLASCFLTG